METAVVTGAGRGIGREIARRLAARGHAVLVTDIDGTAAQETASQLGGSAWATAQDVRDPDSHRAVARAATERGPLRVWVNNAGVLRTAKAWEHSDDELRMMVEANLLGVIAGCRAAIETMREAGSRCDIINIASMSSFAPVPGLAIYAATKVAVMNFTIALQGDLEHGGLPVRVHAVCPDGVDTGMVRERQGDEESAIIFSTPRLLQPQEVADQAVSLLDSDRIVLAIPRSRAWIVRLGALAPGIGLRMAELFRRAGERKRRKEHRKAAAASRSA